jgi:RNA polymerase sigma-70 factor (ECF subfamily)
VGDPPRVPDETLARRSASGDGDAFSELVRRHEARVYSVALRMTGREEDARDAAQDAFLTAFRKLGSFRGDSAFTTWMHRVTINASYDLLRKRARIPEPVAEPAEPRDHAATRGASIDHADRIAEELDVREALAFVPEDFRAVLVLHDMQDLPLDEVATILDLPLGTVKSRCHRARVALGKVLAGERERMSGSGASEGTTDR